MAFRNPSKYRNTVVKEEKKQDWIAFNSSGAFVATPDPTPIAVSKELVAFRASANGTAIGFIPADTKGKVQDYFSISTGSVITGLEFSQFSNMLAVGTENSGTLVYKVQPNTEPSSGVSNVDAKPSDSRVEFAQFHPTAGDLVGIGSGSIVSVWNYSTKQTLFECDHGDRLQSMDWKENGQLFMTCGFDNNLKLFDPRASLDASNVYKSHDGIKATKVIWIGDSDYVFTSGFGSRRNREYALWDVRSSKEPVVLTTLDNSQGIITPLYDSDTNMIYLIGKGDSKISFLEIRTDMKNMVETGGLPCNVSSTLTGAALMPKLGLNVMEGEVARIYSVTSDGSVAPIKATVPRKTYLDFHADIFPDTRTDVGPSMTAEEWLSGKNNPLAKLSLNPIKGSPSMSKSKPRATTMASTPMSRAFPPPVTTATDTFASGRLSTVSDSVVSPVHTRLSRATANLPKHSLYRHVLTSTNVVYEDYSPGNVTVANETNGFEVNKISFGFIQAGSGGRVGVWPLEKKGRLPTKVWSCICGSEVTDFSFDPFVENRITVACEDGKIRTFDIPQDGLKQDMSEYVGISAHSNRISLIAYHPLIKGLMVSASPERGTCKLKIWNMITKECFKEIVLGDMALSVCFDLSGKSLAVLTKDKLLSIYELKTGKLQQQGPSHKGTKASRLIWLHGRDALCSIGFGVGSQRELFIYDEINLAGGPIHSINLDTSPSILIPVFDMDTGVLTLVGRGESAFIFYEIEKDLTPTYLNRYVAPGITTAFHPLPKIGVDVADVEILKGYRATQTSVESVSIKVPRVKKEYFQDDIFSDTIDFNKSAIDFDTWVKSSDSVNLIKVSIKPSTHPKNLSDIPPEIVQVKAIPAFVKEQTEADRKEASMKAMFAMAKEQSKGPLLQDLQEGVAEDEW